MTKAGPAWLKRGAYLAANAARLADPQLATVYHRCMVEKGFSHTKALCVVVPHLLDRVFRILRDCRPYEFRDQDGVPLSKAEARARVRNLAVPEDVRRRLRKRRFRAPTVHFPNGHVGGRQTAGLKATAVPASGPQVIRHCPIVAGFGGQERGFRS